MKALLEDNAPYQARVTWQGLSGASGWNAPAMDGWFEDALNAASQAHFGASCGYIGQGGTIPLMNMLRDRKSTRLNSSHLVISYAVFCLKKKKSSRGQAVLHAAERRPELSSAPDSD